MARDLAQRYPTAKELADDLRRFQTGQIVGALQRARKVTDDGKAALLEFVTSREIAYSRMRD